MTHLTRYTSETYHRFGRNAEAAVNGLVGRGYEHGGRGPETYDCWGIVMAIYRAAGLYVPDPRGSDIASLQNSGIFHWFRHVDRPDFGDVAVFQDWDNDKQHVGVVVLGGRVVHAMESPIGVVNIPIQRLRIREYFRHVEVQ